MTKGFSAFKQQTKTKFIVVLYLQILSIGDVAVRYETDLSFCVSIHFPDFLNSHEIRVKLKSLRQPKQLC